MRVGILGLNHKLADLQLRETVAKICQREFGSVCSSHQMVLLSTCNRTELYFSSEDLAKTHGAILQILKQRLSESFEQKLYSFFGYDCFWHLCRVTSGLDSAIVAETEIQGQVKNAYERCGPLPSEMHFLFQKCLKIGKRVRSEILVDRGMPDLEHAIWNIGTEIFSDPSDKKILFLGASEINRKIIASLHQKKIKQMTLCNRSQQRAQPLIDKYGLKTIPWENRSRWLEYDWIICGTKAPHYVIEGESRGQYLLMDLSVPRNIDPSVENNPNLLLLNIDQLNRTLQSRRDKMNDCIIEAELLVTEEALRQTELFRRKERTRESVFAIA